MPNVARCATAARARHAMLLRMPAVIVLATGGTIASRHDDSGAAVPADAANQTTVPLNAPAGAAAPATN